MPADAITGRLNLKDCQPSEAQRKADLFADQLALTRQAAHDAYVKAQEKRKPVIDANRSHIEFSEGDQVLVYQNQLKVTAGGKFKPRYTGPWIVLRRFSPNTYLVTIADRRGKGRLYENDIVNVCRMKRFIEREKPIFSTDLPNEANHETNVNFNTKEADHRFTNHNIVSGNDDHNSNDGLVLTDQGECDVGSEPDYVPYGDVVSRPPPPPLKRPTRIAGPPKRFADFIKF